MKRAINCGRTATVDSYVTPVLAGMSVSEKCFKRGVEDEVTERRRTLILRKIVRQ